MASAAILAGGMARRFGGRDKSALIVEGRSILDRQLQELSQITDDILLVGNNAPTNLRSAMRVVRDRQPGLGPLAGIDAALEAARDDDILVVACDMPFVTAPLLRFLLRNTVDVDIVVPRTQGGYHPLCAVYTRGCQDVVARRLERRELAVCGLFAETRLRVVERNELERLGDPNRLLANVNTPDEFNELQALLNHKR